MRVAIGCRDHSGWAVLVAVGGDPATPSVLARERAVLVDDAVRMPYHLAADRPREQAAALIEQVERDADEGASRVLGQLVDRLRTDGHEVVGVAVAAGTSSVPTELDAILSSHTWLHAAEGELYREALANAAESLGVAVTRFLNKGAISDAAAALRVAPAALDARLAALRRDLGAPWQKDHREATAAALLVLAG